MQRPAESERAGTPWTWAGAVLFLGVMVAGLVGAGVLLWQNINVEALFREADAPPAVEIPVPPLALPELPETPPWRAYLYFSTATDTFFPTPGYYTELVDRWHRLLRDSGAGVELLSQPAAIERLPTDALLAVPAAVCLSEDEREALRGHVAAGRHVLATWATGTRDARCRWLGYEFVQELTRADRVGTVGDSVATYLASQPAVAMSAGLDPGQRIELLTEEWVALQSEPPYLFWSDWALNPKPAAGAGRVDAAGTTRTAPSGARITWFGFRGDAAASPRDQELLDRLIQNAALWTAGRLLAEIAPWPDGRRSALVVSQDVEHGFTASQLLARRFAELELPVTFFVVSELARRHPDLADPLAAAGEIGSHGVDHRQVAGYPAVTQLTAATQAHEGIVTWADQPPLGFRPPREVYDSLTLDSWRRVGGRYLAATNGARTAAPELHRVAAGTIVVLPRVVDDDYSVMVVRAERSADSLYAALYNGFQKTRSLGGLDLITLHTQLIDSKSRVDVVADVVEAARQGTDVWIAPASEVADWWRARADLDLRLQEQADGSAQLAVRNDGTGRITGASVRLYLPLDPPNYAAPELADTTLAARYEPWGMRVDLPVLEPGAQLSVLLPRRGIVNGSPSH